MKRVLKLEREGAMKRWNRREFMRWSGLVAVGSSFSGQDCCEARGETAKSPNIVYILVDQWRASATGYAGDPNVKTPNLDTLAKESLNFTNAVSVCPVCTPYRASLLTGRYPTSTGMFLNDLYLPEEEICMGELFRKAGYETGYIGKWHLDGHGRKAFIPRERRQGFDYWKGAECDHSYLRSHYYTGDSPKIQQWPGYDAFAQTEDASKFIRERAKGQNPFLLVISYGIPHFPHETAPEEFQKLYPPESIQLPPNVPKELVADAQKEAQGYYGHCTAMDRCVGELLQTLEQEGIVENTILVFTSDHGEMLGSQGVSPRRKQHPYDESIRVPFLLRFPSAHGRTGRLVSTPISTPDILPTLLSLAEIPVPSSVEGEDVSVLVRDPDAAPDRAVLFMNVSPFSSNFKDPEFRGVRTRRYSYVRNLEGPWLLFDCEKDPFQMNNLVGSEDHLEILSELDDSLKGSLKKIGDQFAPRKHYLEKWNYRVGERGFIAYQGDPEPQGPSLNQN